MFLRLSQAMVSSHLETKEARKYFGLLRVAEAGLEHATSRL